MCGHARDHSVISTSHQAKGETPSHWNLFFNKGKVYGLILFAFIRFLSFPLSIKCCLKLILRVKKYGKNTILYESILI